jgi:hypothetical protein
MHEIDEREEETIKNRAEVQNDHNHQRHNEAHNHHHHHHHKHRSQKEQEEHIESSNRWSKFCFATYHILLFGSYFSMVLCILDPLIDIEAFPILTWVLKAIFTVLGVSSLTFYHFCMWSNPGYIPKNVKEPTHPLLGQLYSKTCDKCNHWKPPRAFHCSVCNKCVFKMDHHCVWLCTCIGANNAKFFVQFLVATGAYSLFFNILGGVALLNFMGLYGETNLITLLYKNDLKALIIFSVVLFAIVCTITSYFMHEMYEEFMYGVDRNQTTVENAKDVFGIKVEVSLSSILRVI